MNKSLIFILLSVLFLGTVSVIANNVYVSEVGITSSFFSSNGNPGITQNVSYDNGSMILIIEDGIVVGVIENIEEEVESLVLLYNTSFEDGASYLYENDKTRSPPNWTVVASDNAYFGNGASTSHGPMTSAQDGSYFYVMVSQYNWYQYMEKTLPNNSVNVSFYAGAYDYFGTNPVFKLGFYDSSSSLINELTLNLTHGVWDSFNLEIPENCTKVRFSEQNPSSSYGTYFYLDNFKIWGTEDE